MSTLQKKITNNNTEKSRPRPRPRGEAAQLNGTSQFMNKSPVKPASHMHLTTPATSLVKCLQINIKRVRTYRGFVIFLIFLIMFTTSAGLMFMEEGDEGTYHMTSTLKNNLFDDATFKGITSPDDFYTYLEGILPNFWVTQAEYTESLAEQGVSFAAQSTLKTHFTSMSKRGGSAGVYSERQNYPLHFLMIRQRRVVPTTCSQRSSQAAPLSNALWAKIQDTCLDKLSKSEEDDTYIRSNTSVPTPTYASVTTDPFSPDSTKTNLPPLRYARGTVRSYESDSHQYSLKLPYESVYRENVQAVINDLRDNSWIDYSTRMVVLESIVYNAVRHEYAVLRFVLEFTFSGQTTQFSMVNTFWLLFFSNGGTDTFLFVVDIVCVVYLLLGGYEVIWSLRVNQRSGSAWVGFWEVVTLIHLICLAVCVTLRLFLWLNSRSISNDLNGVALYDKLSEYEGTFVVGRHFFIATLWLTWLRLLEFLRYNSRLNAVTETIRLASADLLSLMLITIFVTLGFAFVANIIWGSQLREFNSIGDCVSWLLRTVFSGDLAIYYDMRDIEPVWTPVFLLVYLIMAWLILLNVVLGILAAGFTAASSNTNDRSWTLHNIKKDLMIMLPQMKCCRGKKGSDSDDDEDDEESYQLTQPRGCCGRAFGISPFYEKRLIAITLLTDFIKAKSVQYQETHTADDNDFHEGDVIISLEQLITSPGWTLSKHETIKLIREANTQVADSFSSAEEAKRREKEGLIHSINLLSQGVQTTVERMLQSAMQDIDAKMQALEERLEENRKEVAQVEGHIDQRLDAAARRAAKENTQLLGIVTGQRQHLDTIAASIFDSESRVRGDISKNPRTEDELSPTELDQWQRELGEREGKIREREGAIITTMRAGALTPRTDHGPRRTPSPVCHFWVLLGNEKK